MPFRARKDMWCEIWWLHLQKLKSHCANICKYPYILASCECIVFQVVSDCFLQDLAVSTKFYTVFLLSQGTCISLKIRWTSQNFKILYICYHISKDCSIALCVNSFWLFLLRLSRDEKLYQKELEAALVASIKESQQSPENDSSNGSANNDELQELSDDEVMILSKPKKPRLLPSSDTEDNNKENSGWVLLHWCDNQSGWRGGGGYMVCTFDFRSSSVVSSSVWVLCGVFLGKTL